MASSGSSLSQVSASGRKLVIFIALFLVVIVVGRSVLGFAVNTYKTLNPPPTPAPTMGFNRIPEPAFPAQLAEDRPSTYEIGTVGNRFPQYDTQATVYFIPSQTPNLVALDRAKEKAALLGFLLPPENVTTDLYRWRRSAPLPSSLEMNILTGWLEMDVDWASSVTLLSKRNLPSNDAARTRSRELMRQAGILQNDIATASPQITYLRALAGELKPVSSVSEADFIRADFWRAGPFGLPTVTSTPNKGVVSVLFSGSPTQGENVLEFHSQYLPVTWTTSHTYPLISANAAFQLLQAGEGYVSQALPDGETTAIIRNIELAYYEPSLPQEYYQPVYFFTGDNGFQAIVPALNPGVFIPDTVAE